MAYARPGIINLDFKDVSSMARDMRDNDWLRNSIDIAGKTLSERDRTILYNRALAEQEGQPIPTEKTSFELMGKGYEAIKSGLSKAASKVKDAAETIVPTDMTFDGTGFVDELLGKPKLKAPFYNYEDKPIEDKPIEDKIDDVSNDNVSNDNASNDNIIVYPSSDKNAPLKSPFYTYSPERSREDMTLPKDNSQVKPIEKTTVLNAPKAEEQAVVEKETTTTNTKRTPNQLWSEMYRLYPQRAEFDWNRIAPKGSGAAGTVQARLEHDSKLDQEIAVEAAALRKDMLDNGWTSRSPEFLDRYATIMGLVAQKYVKGNKDDLIKLIGLSDKEFAQDQSKTKAELDAKKQDFAEKKEMTDIDQKAFEVTNSVMGDILKKQYDKPAQLQATAADLRNAVADPNNINEASIKKAVKAFIQSIDNSVVMSFEAQSFADSSKLGQIRNFISSLVDDNIYSPERLSEIWDNMVSSLAAYNTIADNIVTTAKDFYTQYGGKNVGVIDKWGSLIKANSSLGPKPDFSRVKTWWERYKLGDKNSENPEFVYSRDMKSSPKQEDKASNKFNLEDF